MVGRRNVRQRGGFLSACRDSMQSTAYGSPDRWPFLSRKRFGADHGAGHLRINRLPTVGAIDIFPFFAARECVMSRVGLRKRRNPDW